MYRRRVRSDVAVGSHAERRSHATSSGIEMTAEPPANLGRGAGRIPCTDNCSASPSAPGEDGCPMTKNGSCANATASPVRAHVAHTGKSVVEFRVPAPPLMQGHAVQPTLTQGITRTRRSPHRHATERSHGPSGDGGTLALLTAPRTLHPSSATRPCADTLIVQAAAAPPPSRAPMAPVISPRPQPPAQHRGAVPHPQ